MSILLIILALLPVAVVLYYIYSKDHDPEPPRTIFIAFLWGCVSVVPAILGEWVIHFDNMFLQATFGIGLIEEACKLAMLMLYIWKHADFNDRFDAIVYSVAVSLGFAAVENIMYVIQGGVSVAILRALFSIPGHATFAIIMGYYFAKAKTHFYYGRRQQQYTQLALALLLPTLGHGIFDYLALTASEHSNNALYLLIFVFVIDFITLAMVKGTANSDRPMVQDK
ncbi:MAG: PrsW family intramembrane metalloprotease [Bacteroidales bacterium]|nr:PrsW family intramembrane metalloprotease [Bacteroidales bacterium]